MVAGASARAISAKKPRLADFFFIALGLSVLVVNLVLLFLGAVNTGVNVDEATHVEKLNAFFSQGWYVREEYLIFGEPTSEFAPFRFSYGPVAALWAHLFAVALGVETFGHVLYSAAAYQSRHLAIAVLGMFTIVAGGGIAKTLFRSWRAFVVAAAALSASPVVLGQAMYNLKDASVMAGMTLATLGTAMMLRQKTAHYGWEQSFAFVLLSSGTLLAVGTRPGMWVFLVGQSAVALIVLFLSTRSKGSLPRDILATVKVFIRISLPILFAYLALIAIYPKAFINPVHLMVGSFLSSANFSRWDKGWLSAGSYHAQPPPVSYVPSWLLAKLPGVVLVGLLFFVVVAVLHVFSKKVRIVSAPVFASGKNVSIVFMLMALAGGAPVGALLFHSTLYGGIRQLLFTLPALTLLALLGGYFISRTIAAHGGRSSTLVWSNTLAVTLLLVPSSIDGARLFPYQDSYFGELVVPAEINGNWAIDPGRVSLREALSFADSRGIVDCRRSNREPDLGIAPLTIARPWILSPFSTLSADSCGSEQGDPYMFEAGARFTGTALQEDEFHWVTTNRDGLMVPDNCRVERIISRPLRNQNIDLAMVARCAIVPDSAR